MNIYNAKQVPEMLTIKQVAERTGISAYAIRKLCKQGAIVYKTFGVKTLVNFNKFIEYLDTKQ